MEFDKTRKRAKLPLSLSQRHNNYTAETCPNIQSKSVKPRVVFLFWRMSKFP